MLTKEMLRKGMLLRNKLSGHKCFVADIQEKTVQRYFTIIYFDFAKRVKRHICFSDTLISQKDSIYDSDDLDNIFEEITK